MEDKPIRFCFRSKNYSFLSNFYTSPFTVDGSTWKTVEHYFQAQKTTKDDPHYKMIANAPTPNVAKSLGRKCHLKTNWDQIKDSIMEFAVKEKFTQNKELMEKLAATGNAKLAEASRFDRYWGQGKNGSGLNKLGEILMKIRAQFHL